MRRPSILGLQSALADHTHNLIALGLGVHHLQGRQTRMQVTWETRKIMDLPDLPVSCTCVRIPTLRAHAEAITIETERPVDIAAAFAALEAAPGVALMDDTANNVYPMPLTATSKYDVEVGRVRKNDVFGDCGLDLFVCGDQLLRGAALNAVLIAEAVL
uniref:Semialdehyde dehydrogenase dimerisation domain-containing protein n=1 Tax=Chrysotila carterae TaxID=13221 RepID=A0A7S4F9L4_CHRCT